MFRRECCVFQGTPVENTWRKALEGELFIPGLGKGRVLMQKNGRPVALIFGFVDDFLIHGATKRDCMIALTAYMDLTVRLGFICQKVKTSPPAQVQKCCGMLHDTRLEPTLRVPPNKVSRCLASIDFLLDRPRNEELSRLALAVVTGVLQSVVEATPRRLGQAHHHYQAGSLSLNEKAIKTKTAKPILTWATPTIENTLDPPINASSASTASQLQTQTANSTTTPGGQSSTATASQLQTQTANSTTTPGGESSTATASQLQTQTANSRTTPGGQSSTTTASQLQTQTANSTTTPGGQSSTTTAFQLQTQTGVTFGGTTIQEDPCAFARARHASTFQIGPANADGNQTPSLCTSTNKAVHLQQVSPSKCPTTSHSDTLLDPH